MAAGIENLVQSFESDYNNPDVSSGAQKSRKYGGGWRDWIESGYLVTGNDFDFEDVTIEFFIRSGVA